MAGYQQIATRIGLSNARRGSIEFISQLLQWFRQFDDWLLIVDNLDDIDVLKPEALFSESDLEKLSLFQTLLSENDLSKHIIITTRNKHADWISAERFEIPLLSPDEAVIMLFTLAGIQ